MCARVGEAHRHDEGDELDEGVEREEQDECEDACRVEDDDPWVLPCRLAVIAQVAAGARGRHRAARRACAGREAGGRAAAASGEAELTL